MASRKLRPASAFRYLDIHRLSPVPDQKETPDCVASFQYRNGSGNVSFSIQEQGLLNTGRSSNPAFKKFYVHVHVHHVHAHTQVQVLWLIMSLKKL